MILKCSGNETFYDISKLGSGTCDITHWGIKQSNKRQLVQTEFLFVFNYM